MASDTHGIMIYHQNYIESQRILQYFLSDFRIRQQHTAGAFSETPEYRIYIGIPEVLQKFAKLEISKGIFLWVENTAQMM